jgi:N-acetylmuramic acid 6-phosphate etherase
MKAGTAQRVTLNLLSTLVMIRLGGVHEGLMVDVQANNAKLVERSESILRRLSGRSSEEVRDALRRARGNVKVAMLLLHGCSTDEAAGLLERAGGQLRTALRYAGHHEAAASDVLTSATDVSSAASESVGEK